MNSIVSKISGPPLYLLVLAGTLELLFWVSGVQVQLVEVWIVALVVPLALTLTKSDDETTQKRLEKKVLGDGNSRPAGANRKRAMPVPGPGEGRAPQTQGQRKPTEGQTAALNERAAQKAKIDTCVKEGNVE